MIALIRTEGKVFTDGSSLSPAAFVQLPQLLRASKTDTTRRVEADFSLGDCLYFFAGHACPDFGDVVLAYDSSMADADSGSATPFDTGGLHAGHVHYQDSPGEDKMAYCQRHSRPLATWQPAAQAYVAQYFASPAAYVSGAGPDRDDPTGRLRDSRNSRRAWTWEVRVHRDHPITSSLQGVWMSADYYEGVRQNMVSNPGSSAGCSALLHGGIVHRAPPGETPHQMAEAEVATWP